MALAVLTRKTPHPCAGMTPAQRRDFERIATNERPLGGYRVIKALENRGLIERDEPKQVGKDALGPIMVPQWFVPLAYHMQFCRWASERHGNGTR